LGALSLAIDIPRKEIAGQELQRALDAAALAGANQLDGSQAGIDRAEDMVYSALRQNPIGGDSLVDDQDQLEGVAIEFGFYSAADKKFLPLNGEFYDDNLPTAAITNAVHVAATTDSDATFSRIYGFRSLGVQKRDAFAVASIDMERCVVPLALPACQLFLDQDPNNDANPEFDGLVNETFEADKQCPREIIFTEASIWDPWLQEQRLEGYLRYHAYLKLPPTNFTTTENLCGQQTGEHPNCLADLIPGVIGLPLDEEIDLGEAAEPADIIDQINCQEGEDCDKDGDLCRAGTVRVSLGQYLRPLDNGADDALGLLRDPLYSSDISKATARLINGPPELQNNPEALRELNIFPFKEVFGEKNDPATHKLNYPYLRHTLEDRIFRWQPYGEQEKILLQDMGANNWSVPMCHDPAIPANDDNAHVKQVTVMLIVPGHDDVSYCDFNAQFKNYSVTAIPPWSGSLPRVVGFVDINLFDFNFDDLENERPVEDPNILGLVKTN
jgi:hypothetical protein